MPAALQPLRLLLAPLRRLLQTCRPHPLPGATSCLRRACPELPEANPEPAQGEGPSGTPQPRLHRPSRPPQQPERKPLVHLHSQPQPSSPTRQKIRQSYLSAARPPLGAGLPRDSSHLHSPPDPAPGRATPPRATPRPPILQRPSRRRFASPGGKAEPVPSSPSGSVFPAGMRQGDLRPHPRPEPALPSRASIPPRNHPAAPQEFFGKNSYCARSPHFRIPASPPAHPTVRLLFGYNARS